MTVVVVRRRHVQKSDMMYDFFYFRNWVSGFSDHSFGCTFDCYYCISDIFSV